MNLFDNLFTFEMIPKMKILGVFPLILSYLINCDIDYFSLLNIIKKFSYNNTTTIVNLLENINFYSPLINCLENLTSSITSTDKIYLEKIKENLFNILPMLNYEHLKKFRIFLDNEKVLRIINNYSLISRKKEIIKQIIELMSDIIESHETITDKEFNIFLSVIFSLILYKKNIKSSFIYSTCLSKLVMKDLCNNSFSEFGFTCMNCSIDICLICVQRCHIGHDVIPKSYSTFDCKCSSTNLNLSGHSDKISFLGKGNSCNAEKNLQLPSHVLNCNLDQLSSISIKYPSEDQPNTGNNILFKNPKPNVYISTETETFTITSQTALCTVIANDISDLILDNFIEETIGYFEVEIIMGGYYDQIAVGVSNQENHPIREFAGYTNDSVGYHGDDGKCFVHGNPYTYGTKFGSKDIIGCGLTKSGNVYFTHNSCILPLLDVRIKGSIYPLISLRGKYSSVRIIHDPLKFKFKHKKVAMYKNPTQHLSYSHGVSKMVSGNENLLKNMQIIARRIKQLGQSNNSNASNQNINIISNSMHKYQNLEILKKFKKFALIMHKVCKHSRKNMLKYLLIGDDIVKDKNIKINAQALKYYESEENFCKNQNIIEKVLMRPIFATSRTLIGGENKEVGLYNLNIKDQNNYIKDDKENNLNLNMSSVQQSQTSSFNKKQINTRCNNSCGSNKKCLIY